MILAGVVSTAVAATWWPLTRVPGRTLEAAGLAGATLGVSAFVFSRETNLSYVVFPLRDHAAQAGGRRYLCGD